MAKEWLFWKEQPQYSSLQINYQVETEQKQQGMSWRQTFSKKKSLDFLFLFLFKEINELKRQVKPGMTTDTKKRKTDSLLSTEQ
jgi:hypothetical protein